MRAHLTMLAALIYAATPAMAAELPVLGEGPGPFDGVGPDYKDDEPVRVRIDPEVNGAELPMNATIEILTEGLPLEFEEATALPGGYADGTRRPNAGHLHVYGTLMEPDGIFHETNVFLGAGAFRGTPSGAEMAEATIEFPAPGDWLLVATAQYDDHTLRIMNHPQQWPGLDAALVTVVPEPAGLSVVLSSLVAAARRRTA